MTERREVMARGYRRFCCRICGQQFNERSGGVLNRTGLPSDVIAFVVFYRLCDRLTLRDLSEIMGSASLCAGDGSGGGWEPDVASPAMAAGGLSGGIVCAVARVQ